MKNMNSLEPSVQDNNVLLDGELPLGWQNISVQALKAECARKKQTSFERGNGGRMPFLGFREDLIRRTFENVPPQDYACRDRFRNDVQVSLHQYVYWIEPKWRDIYAKPLWHFNVCTILANPDEVNRDQDFLNHPSLAKLREQDPRMFIVRYTKKGFTSSVGIKNPLSLYPDAVTEAYVAYGSNGENSILYYKNTSKEAQFSTKY